MKSVLFIPVFNQINELPRVLAELREQPLACSTVLLVNNGSNDGSEKLVRESGYEYLDLPENLGVGYSFIKATEWALDRGYEIFAVIASNGKMLPRELSRVLDPIARGEADYVTGSRFLPGGDSPNLPSFRRLSIPLVGLLVQMLYLRRLTDATCGFKAYRLSLFNRAQFDWRSPSLYTYGFEYYLYGKVIRDGRIRWMEVPITMRYPGGKAPYSKIKPFKGWYDMLKPWIVARFDGLGFTPQA
ncbi:MAG: glycosyltransferase family 2 protein [Pseudomonadota bacterium]|jgi:dolichol-phosphate mannosyltransferase